MEIGEVRIEDIELNPKSRDDIPALLAGLQHLYGDRGLQARRFELLEQHIAPGSDRGTGRPGMEMWRILVMGVVKQGLGCDYDRIHELVNEHRTLRRFLGHSSVSSEERYHLQTVIDNVELLGPELLAAVGRLVVESGHRVAGKKPGAPLQGRVDSFVAEPNVHYATDLSLLWEAMRCLIRESAGAAKAQGLAGWGQSAYNTRCVRNLFHSVRSRRRATPERIEAYLARCREFADRAGETLARLAGEGADPRLTAGIRYCLEQAEKHMDLVERRLLKGEQIPHGEKVFSIFEPHTRWLSKGKAGTPVELGVPVCVLEDQFGFVRHHEVMWQGTDVDYAVPMIEAGQGRFPELRAARFDRGFHRPANRHRLDAMLDCATLPKKGRLGQADRERESAPEFAELRRRHPAVESAMANLGHRGLDRVRTHGAEGFARTVALAVLAANIHRLGLLLVRKRRKRLKCAA